MLNGYFNPKERLVVKLRKEGKNYRQIAEEARISPRDIKLILVKYRVDDISEYTKNDGNINADSLMSISSRAYELFEEFMTPLDVAKALSLEAPEVMRYHDEFLELNGRGILAKLFKELGKEGILWLLRLCTIAKTKKMSINQVIECVSIYDEDLPMIKQLREDVNNDVEAAQKQVFHCENRVEYLNHLTEKLSDDVKSKQIECDKADESRRKILELTLRLRRVLSEFKNNNRTYRKIEEFVEDTVDRILREEANMKLLEFALISVLKSLPQKDQYKYRYLLHRLDLVELSGSFDTAINLPTTSSFEQIHSNTIVVRNSNPTSYSQNTANHYRHSNMTKQGDHCPACYEKEILATSKTYFDTLKKLMTDEIMTTISKENLH
ncbi:MAG: hypothetical protein WA941_01430 [Nitrososphaeraceae archaeon]